MEKLHLLEFYQTMNTKKSTVRR